MIGGVSRELGKTTLLFCVHVIYMSIAIGFSTQWYYLELHIRVSIKLKVLLGMWQSRDIWLNYYVNLIPDSANVLYASLLI